jgi:hypothetical protein
MTVQALCGHFDLPIRERSHDLSLDVRCTLTLRLPYGTVE